MKFLLVFCLGTSFILSTALIVILRVMRKQLYSLAWWFISLGFLLLFLQTVLGIFIAINETNIHWLKIVFAIITLFTTGSFLVGFALFERDLKKLS